MIDLQWPGSVQFRTNRAVTPTSAGTPSLNQATKANWPGRLPDSILLAIEAFERAQAEAADGNNKCARRWFDRACRLAPKDQTLSLALATACLGHDDMRAASLFAGIAAASDVREAWFGLAMARRRLGDVSGAATALAEALTRHVPGGGLKALGDTVARDAGAPGWCSLSGDGTVTIGPDGIDRKVELRLDGRSVRHAVGRLPAGWQNARALAVFALDGRHLLGSPVDIRAIRRTVGCVTTAAGGLEGWAWHPGDPDTDPVLTVRAAAGRGETIVTASDSGVQIDNSGLLGRPRGFRLSPEALAGFPGPLHVLDRDARDLLGSPLDPGALHCSTAAAAATLARLYPAGRGHRRATGIAVPPPAIPVDESIPRLPVGVSYRRRAADIVIPVHGGTARVLACLDSVLASLRPPSRIIVIDDASPEPDLVEALDGLARQKRIRLIRNARNQGFPASANAGIGGVRARRDAAEQRYAGGAWLAGRPARCRLRRAGHRHRHAAVQRRDHPELSGPHRRQTRCPTCGRPRALPRLARRVNGGRWSISRSASDSACTCGATASMRWACSAPTSSPRATARRTISACAPATSAGVTSPRRACSSRMSAASRSARPAGTAGPQPRAC